MLFVLETVVDGKYLTFMFYGNPGALARSGIFMRKKMVQRNIKKTFFVFDNDGNKNKLKELRESKQKLKELTEVKNREKKYEKQ